MLNKNLLRMAIDEYKKSFIKERWPVEKFKWEAVKCFQDNWDINADDFSTMLKKSFSKTGNLLGSAKFYPLGMLDSFAQSAQEKVRMMFVELFDENNDLYERIYTFKQKSNVLLEQFGNGAAQHYQYENSISIYLWLHYPDKYYIYKFSEIQSVAQKLESSYIFKKGAYEDNIRNYLSCYDEICVELQQDNELKAMLASQITEECYADPKLKTLTIDMVFFISRCFLKPQIQNIDPISITAKKKYTKDNFLNEVYIAEPEYTRLVAVLKNKKNLILQGAPGVGKTFAATKLAYSIMGEVDESRIEFIQFHQNYSYEDFIMGYKPNNEGFKLKDGIFLNFCKKASQEPDKDFFFIIDEINRGNMSKIFGELLMLIEADYRGKKATLAYNGQSFSVPEKLHIIGMMNTADRSLAMIDYALRRRFSFYNMEPSFESEGFKKYQQNLKNETFNKLIECIKRLNIDVANDRSLGIGFCIGHSYFCNANDCTEVWMKNVIDFDILPMLSEYWFDNTEKLQNWKSELYRIFQ